MTNRLVLLLVAVVCLITFRYSVCKVSPNGNSVLHGISVDQMSWGEEEAHLMKRLGVGTVRLQLCRWPENKARLDFLVNTSLNAGLTVYGEINYCTSDIQNDPPPYIERQKYWHANFTDEGNKFAHDFSQTAFEIAQFFKGRIKYYEIWNEPDAAPRPFGFPKPINADPQTADWDGACGAYTYGTDYSQGMWALCPRQLAVITTNSYMLIKTADPNATIVMGNVLCHGEDGWVAKEYMKQVFKSPAVSWFKRSYGRYPWDIVAIHPYNFIPNNNTKVPLQGQLKWYRQAMEDFGMPSDIYGLAVSEYGFSTDAVTEELQAEYLIASYEIAKQEQLEFLMWFNYLDGPGLQFGIRKSSGEWKLSAKAYCSETKATDCPVS